MKLIIVAAGITFFSGSILAGVYKCSDGQGNTSYQAKPCVESKTAVEMNLKTGGVTPLPDKQKEKDREKNIKKQREITKQELIERQARRKKEAEEQSNLNQLLIRDNPVQYSAFSIPPYRTGRLTDLVKLYEDRLPEIEKFRRFAAKKALAAGTCERVEADNLSEKSSSERLVFSVDCSSAKTFYFNEKELSE